MKYIKKFIHIFFKYPLFSAGFLFLISLLGLFAPIIAPYNPYVADTRARLQTPGIVSGKFNIQNYDLIKSSNQISQKPRWQQLLEQEDPNIEKKTLTKGTKGSIEFKLGPKTSFVDVNRNGNYLDEIIFDEFSNCLGLSQNECPRPNIDYVKIYKKGSIGYIDFVANEDIVDRQNDIISLDLRVIREDTKKWPWWPSGLYLLGTDTIGRDYFSRLIYGARWNLSLMLLTGVAGSLLGTSLGIIAGWCAFKPNYKWVIDEIIQRIVDITSVIPILLIAIMTTLILGNNIWVFALILILFTWQNFVRIIRAKTLSIRNDEYIKSAIVSGASSYRIFTRHILPAHLNDILVIATFNCSLIISLEAVLCFFEIAIPRHWTAWGNIIKLSVEYWNWGYWDGNYQYRYQTYIPLSLIVLVVFSLNFLGDWFRDRLDPKLRQIE